MSRRSGGGPRPRPGRSRSSAQGRGREGEGSEGTRDKRARAPASDPARQGSPRSFRGDRHDDSAAERAILVGIHPVLEALRARTRSISRVFVSTARHDGRVSEVARLARDAGLPVQHLLPQALTRLVPRGLPHQGVAAEIAPHAYTDVETLLAQAGPRTLFVLLDEVQDPRNLGAIARSAAAVGAHGLFLPLHRSASVTPAADKASAGGLSSLPVARVPNLTRLLESMGERGIVRIGLDGRANDLYTTIPGEGPIALVLGGEEKGLRPIVRDACDRLVRIPIPGPVESLNVSVAAAIALYEVLRARARGPERAG